jgi:type IV secretion system protein VirB9
MQDEWDLWRPQGKMRTQCVGKGRARRCTPLTDAVVDAANQGAAVKPTRATTQRSTSGMVRYAYQDDKIYEIYTAPHSPTFLKLPPGERLSAPIALNTNENTPNAWALGMAEQRKGEPDRQEIIALRPLQAPQETTTALIFHSGLFIFLKLIASEKTAMVSVSWDLPAPPASMLQAPEVPITQRPPKIDLGRLFTGYSIEPQGKVRPPWVPVSVFDDGTRTFIRFAEPLTFTRAPGVFGVTPTGGTALVQSHMYVRPDRPEQGAWLLVQGLWPALDLKDNAGLQVRIVRQAVSAAPVKEVKHVP